MGESANMEESQVYLGLRKLIDIVDKLRDVGAQNYIDLPRICVVGTQSAGKSSVLESIVGIDFLPRGGGIVTRRPLELRLRHLSQSKYPDGESWAVFGDDVENRMYDFDEVRRHIERLTDEVAGANKGIVNDPIVLEVFGTQCPDLTLIDLPGITRIPLKDSDQTDDIERLTRELATSYAEDPRTIILAVIPANIDISTSDALQLARKVDPEGIRTIGVVTKIDIMDAGTDAVSMLVGDVIPLNLGYLGVKNRSQRQIDIRISMEEARREEEKFFTEHPKYNTLYPEYLGTKTLVDRLTEVLFSHIRSYFPDIKKELNDKISDAEAHLQQLGYCVADNDDDRKQYMWGAMTQFYETFKRTLNGDHDENFWSNEDLKSEEVKSGSRIKSIYTQLLGDCKDRGITEDMTNEEIENHLRIYEGHSLPGFPSVVIFKRLLTPHLKLIKAPVTECLDDITRIMKELATKISMRLLCGFPGLSHQVCQHFEDILDIKRQETKTILEIIVDSQTGYLFTNDPSYIEQHGSMIGISETTHVAQNPVEEEENVYVQQPRSGHVYVQQPRSGQPQRSGIKNHKCGPPRNLGQDRRKPVELLGGNSIFSEADETDEVALYGEKFISDLKERLDDYYLSVIRNIRDTAPRTIGYMMLEVFTSTKVLQYEMLREFSKPDHLELLAEPPRTAKERKDLDRKIKVLTKALKLIKKELRGSVPNEIQN
eukprot:GHVO01050726.1.p1 GENE.GHVO01050726.1~~GHVO01050726.1.p1  ORF type:complete len:722 (+),score=106.35 GHVO01050726.1:32-2167(+)